MANPMKFFFAGILDMNMHRLCPAYRKSASVHLHFFHISCETSLTVIIPCDRCLTDVPTDFTLSFEKQVNTALADGEDDGESDEANYIDGYHLDVEQLPSFKF